MPREPEPFTPPVSTVEDVNDHFGSMSAENTMTRPCKAKPFTRLRVV